MKGMRRIGGLCSAVFLTWGFLVMSEPSQAQAPSQAAVDEQKRIADYWEAVKRESDAKKAIAEAQVTIANAEAAAKAALAKAEADADKAKLDYLKAQLPSIPDPAKYKLAAPTAPNVAATASKMTFKEVKTLSEKIASAIEAQLKDLAASKTTPPAVATTPPATTTTAEAAPSAAGATASHKSLLLPEDARTRTLIALSRAVREMLDQANKRLAGEGDRLDAKVAGRIAPRSAIFLPALSALGELVLSYATILRTQYGFTTVSQTSLAEAVLRSNVLGKLAASRDIQIIEPDAIIPVTPSPGTTFPELDKLTALQKTIDVVGEKVRSAAQKVEALRRSAPGLPEDQKKAALKLAEEIEVMATALTTSADQVNKALAALYVADAQGNTALDSALRGGMLDQKLQSSPHSYVFSLKAAASDVDTLAANRFFSGLHVGVGSNTIAHWRLTSIDGVIRGSASDQQDSPLEKVKLP